MNAKVLESWIEETLDEAQHMDIPGICLKPEHKSPMARYQIDRSFLMVNIILILILHLEMWSLYRYGG